MQASCGTLTKHTFQKLSAKSKIGVRYYLFKPRDALTPKYKRIFSKWKNGVANIGNEAIYFPIQIFASVMPRLAQNKFRSIFMKIPCSHRYQNNHNKIKRPCHSNNDAFKYSYICRTIENWNSLPEELFQITESQLFAYRLTKHFHDLNSFSCAVKT